MLFFADYSLLNIIKQDKQMNIINFSSFIETKNRINLLPPSGVDYWSKDFDIQYAQFLLSDFNAFSDLVKWILTPLKFGEHVVILVTFDDGGSFDAVTESIQKFMMGRYGYQSFMIKDEYDFVEAKRSKLGSFSVEGIKNADSDLLVYTSYRVRNMSTEDVANYNGF